MKEGLKRRRARRACERAMATQKGITLPVKKGGRHPRWFKRAERV